MSSEHLNSVDIQEATIIINGLIKESFVRGTTPPNVMLHGSPGVGKSSIIQQSVDGISQEIGEKVTLVDIRASGLEASDVQGIPYVDGSEMLFSTPSWFPTDDGYYILFLDEITNCSTPVQHALYRLILDRSIQNGKKLSERVAIVAAGNQPSDKTGAKKLVPAAANRFAAHLIIDNGRLFQPFVNYAINKGFDQSIVAYLSWKKESLFVPPEHEDAFPTPRSWEFVSGHLSSDVMRSTPSLLTTAVASAIGSSVAMDFMSFREVYKMLPDWSRIRSGDPSYEFELNMSDETALYAVGVALGYELISALRENDKDGVTNLVNSVLNGIPDEFKVVMFRTMAVNIAVMAKLATIPALRQVFSNISNKVKL